MRPLHVVVLHEGSGRSFGLLQVRRPIHGQTLFLRGSVVAFDKAILLPMMRITDVDFNAQTGAKPDQRGRKITACGTAHPAWIAIQGNPCGSTILGQGERQGEVSPFLR